MPTDFVIETESPETLDRTLQQMGAVLIHPENYNNEPNRYIMRVFSNPGYVKFACENQGYCKVIKQLG